MCNKVDFLIQKLVDNSINFALITESWLKSQKNHITFLLKEAGFNICHFNRSTRGGGGVAIISSQKYISKFHKNGQYSSFEVAIQAFAVNNASSLTFIVIYRHNAENVSVFFEEFYSFLEYINLKFRNYIIAGDFNIHVNKENEKSTIKFLGILESFSLIQSIAESTHKSGNTLDLLIHNPEHINLRDIEVDSTVRDGRDHYLISFTIMSNLCCENKQEISFRNYKDVVLPTFLNDMANSNQTFLNESSDIDFKSSIELYENIFKSVVDIHAPLITKVVNTSTRPPWMDAEYISARKERRQLFKIWKNQSNNVDRERFEESRAAVDELAKEKRREFYQNMINSSSNSQLDLFKACNTLLDSKQKLQVPYSEDYDTLANNFNDFFVSKIEKIRKNLENSGTLIKINKITNPFVTTFSKFSIVTSNDLLKIIKSFNIKTSRDDPIPALLLKSSIDAILPSLVHLVNLSLQSGSIDGLKESVVTPILKKAGLDCDTLLNYRPVCSGKFIDKLIQKCVFIQLDHHMMSNSLHIPYQSGYKIFHSCETVLLKIVNDILLLLDSNSCCVLLLLDLSAAFDTVDHEELLSILYHEIGIRDTVFAWFKSFLSERVQSTCVKGSRSDTRNMLYGVPQGSVLGPVLFNIYVRNFIQLLTNAGFTVHGYADDHQALTAFKIEFQYHTLGHSLPKCLNLITDWMTSHFLKLNAGKSKLLIFSPKSFKNNIFFDKVYLGNNVFIPVSNDAMNLGFCLDSELSHSKHINMIVSQSYTCISNIGRIRRYLTIDNLRCLVQCVLVSKIDNCNSLFFGISESELSRLQKLQNSFARLIFGRKKSDHVSDLFEKLHWLPVKQRIIFKILLLVFKVFTKSCPLYINDCLTILDNENRILKVKTFNTIYGERAFCNYAPKLWNALPEYLRKSATVLYFKKQVKHYLFHYYQEFNGNVNLYKI